MAGRRVQNEDDARKCLRAVEESGLERAAWAREHGVEPRSLNAWRLNLARAGRRQLGGMLELVAAPSASPRTLTVRCGPFAVEVDSAFDEGALARLLTVIAAC